MCPSGAWALAPITALNWCDGGRTLAEVIRLPRLELGPGDFDFAGYFRFLARRGYVEVSVAQASRSASRPAGMPVPLQSVPRP